MINELRTSKIFLTNIRKLCVVILCIVSSNINNIKLIFIYKKRTEEYYKGKNYGV